MHAHNTFIDKIIRFPFERAPELQMTQKWKSDIQMLMSAHIASHRINVHFKCAIVFILIACAFIWASRFFSPLRASYGCLDQSTVDGVLLSEILLCRNDWMPRILWHFSIGRTYLNARIACNAIYCISFLSFCKLERNKESKSTAINYIHFHK